MKYISYYELIKEMAEEEGIKLRDENGLDEKVLDEFKKNKRRHFRNIAKQVGNLEHFSYLRKKRYRIPIEDKEAIKYQLRQETKPLLKKVKKRLNAKLTLDHIVDMDHIKEELRSVLKQRLQQADSRWDKGDVPCAKKRTEYSGWNSCPGRSSQPPGIQPWD